MIRHTQDDVPWCMLFMNDIVLRMLFTDDIVLVDETKRGTYNKSEI